MSTTDAIDNKAVLAALRERTANLQEETLDIDEITQEGRVGFEITWTAGIRTAWEEVASQFGITINDIFGMLIRAHIEEHKAKVGEPWTLDVGANLKAPLRAVAKVYGMSPAEFAKSSIHSALMDEVDSQEFADANPEAAQAISEFFGADMRPAQNRLMKDVLRALVLKVDKQRRDLDMSHEDMTETAGMVFSYYDDLKSWRDLPARDLGYLCEKRAWGLFELVNLARGAASNNALQRLLDEFSEGFTTGMSPIYAGADAPKVI